MTKIHIKHIGPIKDAAFDFKRINLFIGPQGSGKSTIAKLVSFCSWMEKKVIFQTPPSQTQSAELFNDYFTNLKNYYNLSDVYFTKKSYIKYESDNLILSWYLLKSENSHFEIRIGEQSQPRDTYPLFRNRKINYIPAERNLVSLKGEFRSYTKSYNFIDDFIANFRAESQEFAGATPQLDIDVLQASYRFDETTQKDIIDFNDSKKPSLELCHTSTGMQTLVPLYLAMEYYTKTLYENGGKPVYIDSSYPTYVVNTPQGREFVQERGAVNKELVSMYRNYISSYNDPAKRDSLLEDIDAYHQTLGYSYLYAFSRLIVEEPEQSLFPEVQKELLYHMVDQIISTQERRHDLFVTTHSQYLLYALNNCMLSYLTKESREAEGELENTLQHNINPKDVNIYQIEEGKLKSYRSESGLLGRNYFNDNMKVIMKDFSDMLDYYGED